MTDTVEITITIPAPPEGYEGVTTTKPDGAHLSWDKYNGWKFWDPDLGEPETYVYAVKKKPVTHSVWLALFACGSAAMRISKTLEIAKSDNPDAIEYREITWEVGA